MVKQKKEINIKSNLPSVYTTLMFIGLGLLILTLILLIKIVELAPSGPYMIFMFVFLLLFAVSGFALVLIGTIVALKSPSKMKSLSSSLLDQVSSGDFSSQGSGGGLQIIRPSSSPRSDSISPKVEGKKEVVIEKQMSESQTKPPVAQPKPKESKSKDFPTDFSLDDGLQSIVDRYNTEKVTKAFKNWYNTLMMTFPDISKSVLFKINGAEGIDLSEGFDGDAAVQVTMDSTVFVKMMTKQINPIKAYSSGNLEVKGEMKNMLKLRKLMF
ncbi:MAG: SCP2 sterol-binding domain-containing protein [Candidatus Heimdallarchaeota archaeon]|nr:SCP2 sterol-binding domain-containing protein [Candidatus Heimdallarchaeota archaeon]